MKICKTNHREVAYAQENCPACEFLEQRGVILYPCNGAEAHAEFRELKREKEKLKAANQELRDQCWKLERKRANEYAMNMGLIAEVQAFKKRKKRSYGEGPCLRHGFFQTGENFPPCTCRFVIP